MQNGSFSRYLGGGTQTVEQWLPWDPANTKTTQVFDAANYFEQWTISGATRTKLQPLVSGGLWRPMTDFHRHRQVYSYHSGEATYAAWWGGGGWDTTPAQRFTGVSRLPFPTIGYDPVINPDGSGRDAPSNTVIRCGTELMLKVGANKTHYMDNLMTLRQTLKDPLEDIIRVTRALMAIRKGNLGGAAKALGITRNPFKETRHIANEWLRLQYGYLPTIQDIHDSIELFQKGLRKTTPLMSSVRNISDGGTMSHVDGDINSTHWTKIDINWKTKYKMKVYYSVEPSYLSNLNQMGLINPAEVAWELTPWSFVVDWFIPVGNFLEALTARAGVTFIDGCSAYKVVSDRHMTYMGYDSGALPLTNSFGITSHCESYTRRKLGGFPYPGFYYKSPFSSKHALNALALVRQLLGKV